MVRSRVAEALACGEESFRFSPDTHDQLIASAVTGGASALLGRTEAGLAKMQWVSREMAESNFMLARAGLEVPLGAVMVLSGLMAQGIEHIHADMRRLAALGNYVQPVWGHVFLSDVYLQIAFGAPPPLRVILKNLPFILANKPVAARKARHHLEEVVKKSREYRMPGFLAKGLYGLGFLAQRRKRPAEARRYFEEALAVAESGELFIGGKVRAALESLGT